MSDDQNTTADESAEEAPEFANRAERRAKGKGKGKGGHPHQQTGAGGFTGKGGSYQPPRNYGNRRSG
ncbi:hypothetical protein [Asanoa sp. NPDC050611]|uniref:hypothetical protein n=1 Tax=Asanoa sp. NPDC050611 TaxID=3157098 RepID=UPI0033F890D7